MPQNLVFITGASRGIGKALATTVPFAARIIDFSRSGGADPTIEHVPTDLADSESWSIVERALARELAGFDGERVVFIHNSAVLTPIGFAGEVETEAYVRNVLLNTTAPQVLGHMFLAATRDLTCRRDLVLLSSAAAVDVNLGMSSYGAGKAAVDHWVRHVGAEQAQRGGARVFAIIPGVTATKMIDDIRGQHPTNFPAVQQFIDLHTSGALRDPWDVAHQLWSVLEHGEGTGTTIDLRTGTRGGA